ncbi:hypothetical protein GCM10023194_40940 [Planotetraspora phitsanulokensis]|uniref:Uncharacterized protein n=1 Tax=Planotetraspora phitsanulokensis TaxID=575192 RepID=A0A8J3U8Z0_9ACTN|nr:hypothetical protein [Planotetraspora phitsanulokensis]GII40918.1 hypothetical protein Pph01_59210 [Planotetraspora phitsanulokensis]
MSLYRVEVTETRAPGADRPWNVTRRVLSAESAPCLSPVLVRLAGRRRRIACGRRLPMGQQCRNCAPRILITEVRRVTA